jgi:transmembrane sensor
MLADHTDKQESDRDTALGWIARFRSGSATDEDRQAFALWLSQEPRHKQAMDSMLDMWDDLASVRHLYSEAIQATPSSAANHSNWWRASIATAAGLVLALVLWPQSSTDNGTGIRYQTALGEQQTVELVDGSRMTLNTNSQALVSYDEEYRRIELLRGEAFFEVAKDPSRPFDVDAGNARVTAIGTAFNIYRDSEGSSITVTEGVVRITELGDTGSRPAEVEVLHANQQIKATPAGLQASTTTDASYHTAWQRGELIAQDMTLMELAAQIERYHDIHILITDTSIATLTLSGVFPLNELEPVLQAVQVSLGLEVLTLDDKTLQLIKPPAKI